MSTFYVDAHCHLDLIKGINVNPSSEDNLPIKTITVTNAPFLYEPNRGLFDKCENIRVALGIHPELISQYANQIELFKKQLTQTRYIGEIGLDGSSRFAASLPLQKRLFAEILSSVAVYDKKILTVHSRNASRETVDTLNHYLKASNCKVILHWYSGDITSLRKAISYGYYFSINHKMVETENGSKIISEIPASRILTETDAPFTFDDAVTNRIISLDKCISGIASIIKKSKIETQALIYENFKELLN